MFFTSIPFLNSPGRLASQSLATNSWDAGWHQGSDPTFLGFFASEHILYISICIYVYMTVDCRTLMQHPPSHGFGIVVVGRCCCGFGIVVVVGRCCLTLFDVVDVVVCCCCCLLLLLLLLSLLSLLLLLLSLSLSLSLLWLLLLFVVVVVVCLWLLLWFVVVVVVVVCGCGLWLFVVVVVVVVVLWLWLWLWLWFVVVGCCLLLLLLLFVVVCLPVRFCVHFFYRGFYFFWVVGGKDHLVHWAWLVDCVSMVSMQHNDTMTSVCTCRNCTLVGSSLGCWSTDASSNLKRCQISHLHIFIWIWHHFLWRGHIHAGAMCLCLIATMSSITASPFFVGTVLGIQAYKTMVAAPRKTGQIFLAKCTR